MARPFTGGERAAIAAPHVNHYLKIEVQEPTGTWVDLSTLGGVDWVTGLEITEDIDQPTATATVVLRRESQGQTLAPLITASAFNNIPGFFSPLLYAGRRIRFSSSVTAALVAPVAFKSLGIFKIDEVDWASSESEITIQCRDIGAIILDTFIEAPDREYGADGGEIAENVMQAILDDWPPSTGAPGIAFEEATAFMILRYAQEQKSVLEAVRDVALQAAGDVRYRFNPITDSYALTFWRPDRAKVAPDWTLGPAEYHAVDELKVSDADVRNVIEVQYVDESGDPQTETVEDATSIVLYERRWMGISEDGASQINTSAEALRMANGALSDLAQPKEAQSIVTKFFWLVQIGDLGRFSANAVHYDVDTDLAVVGFTHSFADGEANTTLRVRGKPAGAIRGWLNKSSGGDTGGVEDTRALALKNFREKRRTPTAVTYGWDALDAGVFEVWAWGKLSPLDADPPLPPEADEDRLWRDTEGEAPDIRLDNTSTEFEITVPDFGFIQTWELLPVAEDGERGFPQRVKVLPVNDIPRITNLETEEGASGLFKDITALDVTDPQALGGRLTVWLNHDSTEDADPSGNPDGWIDVGLTPHTFDAGDTFTLFVGGTSQLFDNIRIHPGAGKRVFFEFENTRGTSSGVIGYVLLSNGGIIDADGELLDDSINRAEQVAASMTLPSVYDVLPVTGRANELALLTTDSKLYRWNGSAWTAEVPAPDVSGVLTAAQIQDYSIGLTKIATSIAAPEILTSLPPTPGPNRVALLTTDGVLYRSTTDGSAWTAVVAATNISGQIVGAQIAAAAITGPLIAAAAITSTKIDNGAITTPKLVAGAVTANELATGSVTAIKILAGAVTAVAIDAGAVTTVKLAAGAVTANEIGANAIIAGKVAASAISTTELAANAVTAAKIGAGEIVTTHMNANSITGDRIATNTLNANRIIALSITSNEIGANAIIAAKIAAGAVTATAILAGAVTATKISVTILSDITTNAGIIVAGKLQSIDGLRYLDLNAASTNPFLQHPSMTLRADGSAIFGGVVTATSFTGANATFSNGMTVGGATLFVTGGDVIFGSGAAPRLGPVGDDLVLAGRTSGTTLVGRVKKQIGGVPGTPVPIPCVVVETTGAAPSNPGNYSQGDMWCDTSNLRIFVIAGGLWTQTTP